MKEAILIVGGGLLQVPAVKIAKQKGLFTVVTDMSDNAPAMLLADEAIVLDIYDLKGHEQLVIDLQKKYKLMGVFTEGADVEVTVAKAAKVAKTPGISVEAAFNTKNKARMRYCFERAGIENPLWKEVKTFAEARLAIENEIGFPVMVKSVDNCASRGTTRVIDMLGLPQAFENAVKNSTTGTALLETCLVGTEHSAEIIFDQDGSCFHLNVGDRVFADDKIYALEIGHINPTKLTLNQQKMIYALMEKAAKAVGINFSVLKADVIWTVNGPRLLEITARLSGGFDCQYTTPLASGRNFISAAMDLAIGKKINQVDLEVKKEKFAAAWTALPEPGIVESIGDIEEVLVQKGVKEVFLRTAVGEIIRPYYDCAARPAFIIAEGDTYEEALQNAQKGSEILAIKTKKI